jgi:hypothetical protein
MNGFAVDTPIIISIFKQISWLTDKQLTLGLVYNFWQMIHYNTNMLDS